MEHSFNTADVEAIIRECAARYILPRFKKLQDHEIETKTSPSDFVTAADIETEAHMDKALPALCPGSVVIGEEAVHRGESSTETLINNNKDIFWVVDPVDGTYNFRHGDEKFAVMLACVIDGETRYGWIYDVMNDQMTFAEKGKGVFLDGIPLTVKPSDTLEEAAGNSGRNKKYFPASALENLTILDKKVKNISSMYCAGHEYLALIKGESDFSIYSKTKPWDHLAGVLMVQEAGGHCTKWDKTPYKPGDDGGGIIAASSQKLWRQIHDIVVNGTPPHKAILSP